MAEQIDLTTPIVVDPRTVTAFRIGQVFFNVRGRVITVELFHPATGVTKQIVWNGDEAQADMIALNKANLTNNSLNARLLNKCITKDPSLSGTVTGTPD